MLLVTEFEGTFQSFFLILWDPGELSSCKRRKRRRFPAGPAEAKDHKMSVY